jgi:DNA invertase Pin-like site-specific DNA recombinase
MKNSSSKIQNPNVTFRLTNIEPTVTVVAGQLHRLIDDYFGNQAVQKIVTYFRVSTTKQGQSGLGLEGQQASVDAFVSRRGCQVVGSYTEVESGKRADRPQLAKALAHAKRSKATLVVAKLDRLARNVHFMSSLMESAVDFIAIDLEHANRLTIHILSAVAEGEAKAISDRTKAALQAAKARGTLLGSARTGHWDGHEKERAAGAAKGREVSAKVRSEAAQAAYVDLIPTMKNLRDAGKSLREIADALNTDGHSTRRGKPWNAVQVTRVLERAN